jgi:tRNA G18 (ribose-2'-O)-methylase SpoU
MAESEMVLRRLLQDHGRLHALLISPERLESMGDAITRLPDAVPVYVADVDAMTEIAGFHIHRGVLAAGIRPAPWELTLDRALGGLRGREDLTILVAEGLTNVDNMGGLFRNAAAFGADGIVLDPACCDPLYRKAIRVSMGHVLSTPWAVGAAWPDDLLRLKREWGVTIVGGEVTPSAAPLWEMPRARRLAMVFGAEAHGLSAGALAACDAVCTIPMSAGVPSINVAVASAVFLYERRRGGA